MEINIIEIICGLILLVLGLYYYLTSTFTFWKIRGIPGPEPKLIFGNLKEIVFGKKSASTFIKEEYENYKNYPLFGIFAMKSPVAVVNDPELIKDVLIKHFSSFASRGVRLFEKVEPLSLNLINLEYARWKPLRAKQTTMFTATKLKEMFYILMECADHLENILNRMHEKNDVLECCEVTARFTTDVIGACVFGIDMKALEDENSEFRKVGRKFIHADKWRRFKLWFKQIFPRLYNILRPIMYDHEINDFFINTMIQTIELRKKNRVRRGDFVDLLIDMKENSDKMDIELTDTLLTAQAFAFFFAGFDTSSITMSHACYELALNQNIQDKLRNEINEELSKNNGKLEFSSIANLKYLHKVFSETLRKYPITPLLSRKATESYTFTGTHITIPKGTIVWIPVFGIHRDPNIYPNPEIFDPERFEEDSIKYRHPSHYLPFGDGPRNCIGARFGNYQSKVGLITILKNYKIDICDQTPVPYESSRRRFLLGPHAGIHLKFVKIN